MPGPPDPGRLPSAVAAVLAFVPSAVTLLVEVVAIRLLAPRIGSSIETYTAAIGVVLAGLAAGAYLGGRAADAFGPRRLIAPVLLLLRSARRPRCPRDRHRGRGAACHRRAPSARRSSRSPASSCRRSSSRRRRPLAARGSMVSTAESGSVVGRISAIATVGALRRHVPDRVRPAGRRSGPAHPASAPRSCSR